MRYKYEFLDEMFRVDSDVLYCVVCDNNLLLIVVLQYNFDKSNNNKKKSHIAGKHYSFYSHMQICVVDIKSDVFVLIPFII